MEVDLARVYIVLMCALFQLGDIRRIRNGWRAKTSWSCKILSHSSFQVQILCQSSSNAIQTEEHIVRLMVV